jgi:hypothetical protein
MTGSLLLLVEYEHPAPLVPCEGIILRLIFRNCKLTVLFGNAARLLQEYDQRQYD